CVNWTSDIANAANILTTIWYRTQTAGVYAFHTYNSSGGIGTPIGVTGVIPPMQAFWVRVNAGGGTLTLNNSMRSHGSVSNPLKVRSATNLQQKILRLQVSNGTNNDEAVVYFNPEASDSFDTFDSPKMTNGNNAIPEIYTLAGIEEVAINGLGTLNFNKELPLGFSTKETNYFTIKASQICNFAPEERVLLKDNFLNKEQDLTDEASYTFTSDPTNSTNRFSLIFRTQSTVTDMDKNIEEQDIDIYKNTNNQIVVRCIATITNKTSVYVYNSLGELLVSKQLTDNETVIQTPNNSGVYMIKVVTAKKNTTKKVVLK
ncbi:MAG TPA: T9SS type A sorting domain-containing protein, partial [Paludibacter sp.]